MGQDGEALRRPSWFGLQARKLDWAPGEEEKPQELEWKPLVFESESGRRPEPKFGGVNPTEQYNFPVSSDSSTRSEIGETPSSGDVEDGGPMDSSYLSTHMLKLVTKAAIPHVRPVLTPLVAPCEGDEMARNDSRVSRLAQELTEEVLGQPESEGCDLLRIIHEVLPDEDVERRDRYKPLKLGQPKPPMVFPKVPRDLRRGGRHDWGDSDSDSDDADVITYVEKRIARTFLRQIARLEHHSVDKFVGRHTKRLCGLQPGFFGQEGDPDGCPQWQGELSAKEKMQLSRSYSVRGKVLIGNVARSARLRAKSLGGRTPVEALPPVRPKGGKQLVRVFCGVWSHRSHHDQHGGMTLRTWLLSIPRHHVYIVGSEDAPRGLQASLKATLGKDYVVLATHAGITSWSCYVVLVHRSVAPLCADLLTDKAKTAAASAPPPSGPQVAVALGGTSVAVGYAADDNSKDPPAGYDVSCRMSEDGVDVRSARVVVVLRSCDQRTNENEATSPQTPRSVWDDDFDEMVPPPPPPAEPEVLEEDLAMRDRIRRLSSVSKNNLEEAPDSRNKLRHSISQLQDAAARSVSSFKGAVGDKNFVRQATTSVKVAAAANKNFVRRSTTSFKEAATQVRKSATKSLGQGNAAAVQTWPARTSFEVVADFSA